MDLVDARKKARYTQEEVANLLGISRPTYARMEKSPQDISIKEARNVRAMKAAKSDRIARTLHLLRFACSAGRPR